jgi:hypothetical protein
MAVKYERSLLAAVERLLVFSKPIKIERPKASNTTTRPK